MNNEDQKARRLNHESWFLKISAKKNIIDVKLVNGLFISERKSENNMYSSGMTTELKVLV